MSKPKGRKLNKGLDEQKLLIEFCVAKKRDFIDAFLKEKSLRASGNKEELRQILSDYIRDGELSLDDLTEFLNKIEGWGNQHIFFYKATPGSFAVWRQPSRAKQLLARHHWDHLLNVKRPVMMPDRAELASIELSDSHLKFVWVEKRIWFQRLEDLDEERDGDMLFKAFRMHLERRVTWFELNLLTGHAYLAIPNVAKSNANLEGSLMTANTPKKDHYDLLKEQFEIELDPVLTMSMFRPPRLSKAINSLRASTEVKSRQSGSASLKGTKIVFTSIDEQSDWGGPYCSDTVLECVSCRF
jgi:hypothetical protein